MSYISLGLVEKEQLFDEFADPVFKLKENEFTKLIKTDIGWHILKVTEIIRSKSKELDEVRNIIKDDIALDKSYDELDTILIEVEKDITNPGPFVHSYESENGAGAFHGNLRTWENDLTFKSFCFESALPELASKLMESRPLKK